MLRRRRRIRREIEFSFDSFLDLVTNVVGIIIRLILVAWVGARAYHSLPEILKQAGPKAAEAVASVPFTDPLQGELDQRRAELAQAESRLLEQLRRLELSQSASTKQEQALAQVKSQQQQVAQEAAQAIPVLSTEPAIETSLDDLQARQQKVLEEIQALEKQPPPSRQLRYHVPVSKTVTIDEWHFECQHQRVTYFPLGDLEAEIQAGLPAKIKQLHSQWQVSDVTPPIGAFQLRYTAVREKRGLDNLLSGAPHPTEGFSGYLEWQAEPVEVFRGESAEQALAPGSAFRKLVDRLDGELSAVTFWVYPDSFGLYRQLRDYLVERGFTVAARPLPFGMSIAGSPRGSASRGQ